MAQIILNVESPTTLLRDANNAPAVRNFLIGSMENLRDQVLPCMLALIDKSTVALPEQFFAAYFAKVASNLERAWLTNIAANIVKPSCPVSLPLLIAVELRYLTELILDDIADGATERCGFPTVHLQIGVPKAVYLAEMLMAAATESLGEALKLADISTPLFATALKSWAQGNLRVNSAQYQNLAYENTGLDQMTPDMALELVDGTTGQGLANCFFLGGLVGGADYEQLEHFHEIGQCIGTLMQIRDDLFDYVDNAQLINKEPLLDFKNGQKKIPIVVAFHHANDLEKQEILALCQQSEFSAEDIVRIQQLILNPTAIAYQAALCDKLISQIEQNLKVLGAQGEATDTFRFFVHKYFTLAL